MGSAKLIALILGREWWKEIIFVQLNGLPVCGDLGVQPMLWKRRYVVRHLEASFLHVKLSADMGTDLLAKEGVHQFDDRLRYILQ